jgi:hypothetical protein
MGIETIIIVIGLAIVVAIAVGVMKSKRRLASKQAPKPPEPSGGAERR